MTFEEWLEQSECKDAMLLDNADVIMLLMKKAWQAGQEEVYKECNAKR